jgi:small-conductance mechanosensitive channel
MIALRPASRSPRAAAAIALHALLLLACLWGASAASAAAAKPERQATEATLSVANRDITTFRSTMVGYDPAARAERSYERISRLDGGDLAQPARTFSVMVGEIPGISVYVGDNRMFTLSAADLDPEEKLTLEQYAEEARKNLAAALQARLEQRQWPIVLNGLLHAAGATALLAALVWAFRRVGRVLRGWLGRRRDAVAAATAAGAPQWREYLFGLLIQLLQLLRWVLILVLGYAWMTYALEHFPLTQPLGHELMRFVGTLGQWLVLGIVDAAPGIATIAVILFITRAVTDAIGRFFNAVQSGRTSVRFLHKETVPATRRIVSFVVWVFAIAVAYPFIPGSGSDAFKGLSVLIGVMVSLGSTGLINQMMGGLVLVYSRALRKGDFVVLDGVEGVVSEVGTLATKVVTMRNEEITIPNSTVIASPIRNYSKLAGTTGTMLTTKVTIGYDAPWRQVHAMLELAAARTAGLRQEPKPFVYQRALSDFYAEYELFAYTDRPLERVATLSALHANIQDVFNEHGVQILSPHFVLQPKEAVVVPPADWYPEPAKRPDSEGR